MLWLYSVKQSRRCNGTTTHTQLRMNSGVSNETKSGRRSMCRNRDRSPKRVTPSIKPGTTCPISKRRFRSPDALSTSGTSRCSAEIATEAGRTRRDTTSGAGTQFSVFVVCNAAWLVIWIAAIFGLRSARPAAFFAAWFLAVAGMVNGLAHPLSAVATGGYFPGMGSSTLVAVVCGCLWYRLHQATAPRS